MHLEIAPPAPPSEKSWTDKLHPEETWLIRRQTELQIAGGIDTPEPDSPYSMNTYAGGGTKLEGSAYFWFFTWLMLGTAILFIPYAYFYKGKTILQE